MIHTNNHQDVVDALNQGHNVFITGSAGSGKTYLASHFARSSKTNTVMTATTGVAALNLGGETIHRFLGIGTSCRPFEIAKIIAKWEAIKRSSKAWDVAKRKVMENLNTLIIDEVSMLRRDQFELIDAVLASIKENTLPFGGVQMVLVGDFLQLPPVVTSYDYNKYSDLNAPYCFQSSAWKFANFKSFNLTTNFRQASGDFLNALENIRIGNITAEVEGILNSRTNAALNSIVSPVRIFTHKVDVDKENIEQLKKLPGDKFLSEAEYTGKPYDVEILQKESPADDKLYFCVGAQIIMLTNDSTNRWVNGTMGIIESCQPLKIRLSNNSLVELSMHKWEKIAHVAKKDSMETKVIATMEQYPFKLAYGASVHRTQGLTLDYIDLDLEKCFTTGQAYVALSRCRELDGITIRSWNKNNIKADKSVLNFYGL